MLTCEIIMTPHRWRSWNLFAQHNDDTTMRAMMAAFTDKSRDGADGTPTSLREIGYVSVGMDDGWQQCNCSTQQGTSSEHCPFHQPFHFSNQIKGDRVMGVQQRRKGLGCNVGVRATHTTVPLGSVYSKLRLFKYIYIYYADNCVALSG